MKAIPHTPKSKYNSSTENSNSLQRDLSMLDSKISNLVTSENLDSKIDLEVDSLEYCFSSIAISDINKTSETKASHNNGSVNKRESFKKANSQLDDDGIEISRIASDDAGLRSGEKCLKSLKKIEKDSGVGPKINPKMEIYLPPHQKRKLMLEKELLRNDLDKKNKENFEKNKIKLEEKPNFKLEEKQNVIKVNKKVIENNS
ncbi:hypothetical protein HK099_003226, partial [Clydaea vesicula]